MPNYVAYVNGLRHKDASEEDAPVEVGADVNPGMFSDEDWEYHLAHGNVVRKGGPHDPAVLNAAAEEEIPKDPKDQEIQMLRQQLALYTGRNQTPPPGSPEDQETNEEVSGKGDSAPSSSKQAQASKPADTKSSDSK